MPIRLQPGEAAPILLLTLVFAAQIATFNLLALLYQGVMVAGVCFIAWTALLKSYSPSRISVILFTTPLFGIVLSRLVLGEPVSPYLGAGGLLVALGIALAQR